MEVILQEKIKKLGNIGEVVRVKGGYGRNYLIPNGKAVLATKANKEEFEQRRSEIEARVSEHTEAAKKIATKIDKVFITLIRQSGEDGRLFGSVTAKDISDGINSVVGLELDSSKIISQVDKSHVILNHSIKYTGVYEVTIHFSGDVEVQACVNVARTETEAEEAKKNYLAAGSKQKSEKLGKKSEVEEITNDEIIIKEDLPTEE